MQSRLGNISFEGDRDLVRGGGTILMQDASSRLSYNEMICIPPQQSNAIIFMARSDLVSLDEVVTNPCPRLSGVAGN